MNAKLADMTNEQLATQVRQSEMELVGDQFAHSMNQLENTAQLKVARRKIAAMKTEIRRREIEQGLPKSSILNGVTSSGGVVAGDGGEDAGFLKGIVDKMSGKE